MARDHSRVVVSQTMLVPFACSVGSFDSCGHVALRARSIPV